MDCSHVVQFCRDNNILAYSAAFPKPFFDEGKNRVSKGNPFTVKHKHLPGTWDDSSIRPEHTALMFRTGAVTATPRGSGFLVMDFDVKGGDNVMDVFGDLIEKLREHEPLMVRTGSGGAHLYYRIPPGLTWTKELNLDSITLDGVTYDTKGQLDILAGGGSVFLPGSYYTYEGQRFAYTAMEGTSLADAPLLPEYLIQAFNSRATMTGNPPSRKSTDASITAVLALATPRETAPTAPTPPVGRSITPQKVSDDDLRIVVALCDCLTPEWLSKYTNWRDLVFCLKNLCGGREQGLTLAVATASRSPRHNTPRDATATKALWDKASTSGGIGFATLNYWARQCSPEKAHNCFKDNYATLLFCGNKGHADIFVTELAGSCVYDSADALFWLWLEHKQLWKPVGEDNITAQFMTLMPSVVRKIRSAMPPLKGDDDSPDGKKATALIKLQQAFSNSMPEPVMKCLRDALNPVVSHRNIDSFTLDRNPDYLPLANGVWNFKENKLEEYTRQHYISKRLDGLAYNPKASQEHIKEAMRLWFKGNDEVIDFVQYWLGYCLTGYLTRQDFLIVYGTSAGNGKTTLFEEILQQDILGNQFTTSMGEDALTKVGGNNDDIYYSFGKRLALCSEAGATSGAKEINISALKRITGNGVIAAEAKFKGKKEEAFSAKVVFICNELPKMPQDKGQRRRTNVLEMNTKFVYPGEWDELTDEERESGAFGIRRPEFITALRKNKEGTLLWLLEGAKRYMDEPERTAPVCIRRYTEEALANACPNRRWFLDGYEHHKTAHKGKSVPFKEIAEKWQENFGIKATNMSARGKFLKIVRELVGEASVTGDSHHGYTVHCLIEK